MASIAKPTGCVIYVRISQDRSGEELGVERHERDCRELAQRLGFEVLHVYSDNDHSATSGRVRPAFEAMLASNPPSIVAWHQDRLLRLTKDLERVIDVGAPVYFVTSAENGLDLASPAGRAVARTVAAWSQYEGEQKRIRQLSKNQQLIEHGHWQFSIRPYGYRRVAGKIEQVPEEVATIRDGYEQALRGASYRSIAAGWNARGVKPRFAEQWSSPAVQSLLENPHYGGILRYRGQEVELEEGRSIQWTPVLTPREWADFRELKLNRKRKRTWATTPKHLMSGMLRCGVCDGQMYAGVRTVHRKTNGRNGQAKSEPVFNADGSRAKVLAYRCIDRRCTSIRGEYLEELVRTVVIKELADERIVKGLRRTDAAAGLEDDVADLTRRQSDLVELLGEGLIERSAARSKLEDLRERLSRARSRLSAARAESPLSDIRLADSIPERWDSFSVLERRRTISDLGMEFSIKSADMGPRPVDPATGTTYTERAWAMLRVEWRMDEPDVASSIE